MATAVLDLGDRVVADDGTVVCSYALLIDLARDGFPFTGLVARRCPEVVRYNRVAKDKLIEWVDDGQMIGPSEKDLTWRTPMTDRMKECGSVQAMCSAALMARLAEKNGSMSDETLMPYAVRLEEELVEMESRGMLNLVKHLEWMIDDWTKRGVVWGAGRGSSCASLVLWAIGLHEVDPVEHDIPLGEFLRRR